MPHPFDKLKFSAESGGWVGKVKLSSLRDCYGKWHVHWDEIDGPYPDPRKPREKGVGRLLVLDAERKGITAEQRAAVDYLMNNEANVTNSLVAFFLKQAKAMYYSQSLPSIHDCDGDMRETRKRFDTASGVRELIQFVGLTVAKKQRAGLAYTVFLLASPLDDEHGFSVALHRDKAKSWAGLGELGGL